MVTTDGDNGTDSGDPRWDPFVTGSVAMHAECMRSAARILADASTVHVEWIVNSS